MITKRLFALTLLATLALTGAVHADETVQATSGSLTLVGRGRLAAVGFGKATITGRCVVQAAGVGKLEAPAGVKYKTAHHRSSWLETDGSPLKGMGKIRVRVEEGQSVTFTMGGRLVAWTRLGSEATAELHGKGRVTYQARIRLVKGTAEASDQEVSTELEPLE